MEFFTSRRPPVLSLNEITAALVLCFLGLALGLFDSHPQALRPSILTKLIFSLKDMVNGPVIAVAVWILGEYCEVCQYVCLVCLWY